MTGSGVARGNWNSFTHRTRQMLADEAVLLNSKVKEEIPAQIVNRGCRVNGGARLVVVDAARRT